MDSEAWICACSNLIRDVGEADGGPGLSLQGCIIVRL